MTDGMDLTELKKYQKNMEKLCNNWESFCRECSHHLAARLLSMVIPRTPVGDYSDYAPEYQKQGGDLRRGWTAGRDMDAKSYAYSLPVRKLGYDYEITVKNVMDYASYVENGHRQTPGRYVPAIGKQLKKSWVDGQFFLTISEDELRRIKEPVLAKLLETELRRGGL